MKRPFEAVEHAPPEHEQHTETKGSEAPAAVTVVDDGSDGGNDDADLGLDVYHRQRLARALGVDLCCAPVETLAYAVLRKHDRGIPIHKNDILDVWHAIPKKYKLKEAGNNKARMFLVGANPRQVDAITNCTDRFPHSTKLLNRYASQVAPGFGYTCIGLRSNCLKAPHRDTRNIGESLVCLLTRHSQGGHLWVANSRGDTAREHQGEQVLGRIQDITAPYIFSARGVLHATESWPPTEERVILVAFTPLKSLEVQHQLHRLYAFPVQPPAPRTWRQHQLTQYFPLIPEKVD